MTQHLTDKQLADYRRRRVSPAELLQIDEHLSLCSDCRDRAADESDLHAAMGTPPLHRSRHLTYEQLEAYVDRKVSIAESEAVLSHVRTCRSCFDELGDLQAFKRELDGSKASGYGEQKSAWMQRLSQTWVRQTQAMSAGMRQSWSMSSRARLALAVSAVALLALAVALDWRWFGSWLQAPSPQVATSPSSINQLLASLSPDDKSAVLNAISQQRVSAPGVVAELQGKPETLLGKPETIERFEVIAPVGEVVLDSRPDFRWQALAGAHEYSVAVFDANLNPVGSSPPLQGTHWKMEGMLKRGQVYRWQVTARLRDGRSVNSPAPPSPEAEFQVLDQEESDKLERFKAAHPDAHLVLGILYAQAGMLDEGERELTLVGASDPNYGLADRLLNSIRQIRHAHT